MRLGPHTLTNPWVLAPMAGVSELPFRLLAHELGAAATPTELISAKGLCYGQARTAQYLRHEPWERPFWVQLFGGEPEVMAEGAARAAELGAEIIDVNMGCPVRKVTKTGAGAALMTDPPRAARIVAAIRARTGLVVTAKIRSGWDETSINAVELTLALADAGCAAVALHARTRVQGYAGLADWSLIARLVRASPIPILGNGGAFTAAEARRLLAETGCAAVMIARGAMGNPWIFRELVEPRATAPTPRERGALVLRHFALQCDFVGDVARAVRSFRSHLTWYAHGLHGAAAFRAEIMRVREAEELVERCAAFFDRAETQLRAAGRDTLAARGPG